MSERLTVVSGSARLAAEREGDGEDVAVLLHAGVCDRRSWRPVAGRLSAGATVVSYDRRGFGETRCAPEPHAHAEDLERVVSAVADRPVWLVGSSQGGRVALDFALAEPDRVAGLVLVSPAISGAPEPELSEAEQRLGERFDAAEESGDLDALNRLEAHIWLDGPAAPEGRVSGPSRDLFLDMNGRALAAEDPGPAQEPPSAMEALSGLAVPTLVIWGDLDVTGIVARSAWLAREVPGARAEVFEGTAHLPYLEAPAAFAGLVAAFIARAG